MIRDTLPKLYTLTGHGESALSASFQVRGGKAEYGTGGALPAHGGRGARRRGLPADLVGRESDLTQEEKEAILAYLQEGGD